MDLGPISRGSRRLAALTLQSTRKLSRGGAVARSKKRSAMGKTTNCSSPSRLTMVLRSQRNGDESSHICRSPRSAVSINHQPSTINLSLVGSFISHSEEETIAFARDWAQSLRPNDVVALRGELGAGKTQFVKGI